MEYDKRKPINPLVEYYKEHNISPVHQPIGTLHEYSVHLMRREKLYRTLGMPPGVFRNSRVLEVGPGGGYNSLAFFEWGASVDFVEPNPKGQEELVRLMRERRIADKRWRLFCRFIEDFIPDVLYDVVIAEGFIPGICNQSEVLMKIDHTVKPGGVVVVTCEDDISCFAECLKRIVATRLIELSDECDYKKKIEILTKAFSSHLKKLPNATRPIEDWVMEMLLNPALLENMFSVEDCLKMMGDHFLFLGSSPAMFTDYSWYKDIDQRRNEDVLEQFARKRHTLILWDLADSSRGIEKNEKLLTAVRELRIFFKNVQSDMKKNLEEILKQLQSIKTLSRDIDPRIEHIIDETYSLLIDDRLDIGKVANAEYLSGAFGRGQQYISMVKKLDRM